MRAALEADELKVTHLIAVKPMRRAALNSTTSRESGPPGDLT
jgi:hypothetical protein